MSHIYVSQENDPYFNVAAEYQLFLGAKENVSLFLWQNESTVIFGRNQNVYAESDLAYLKRTGIVPVRRFSGGGAVFQDMGNVNFTFIVKENFANADAFLSVIQQAVSSLGLECTFSGRNDLLCEGKKFSGHAYYIDNGRYLYHGTIMVHVDLDKLSGALSPSLLKLQSKGIASVRSRVINLSQLDHTITIKAVQQAMIAAFRNMYGQHLPIEYVNQTNLQPETFEQLQSKQWIYGESPEFSITEERKLSFGNVTLSAEIENGRIQRMKIYTDSLYTLEFVELEQRLIHTLFDSNEVFAQINEFVERL